MIFASFDEADVASRALRELEVTGFEPAGFSAIAPQGDRGGGEATGPLEELMTKMTQAPRLGVDGRDVACAGALPHLLPEPPEAALGGLRASFVEAGARPETARRFEKAIEQDGLIVGVAAEGPDRARTAEVVLGGAGADATTSLEVPSAEDRPRSA